MNIKLTILGNNSAIPAYDRHPTAQVIDIREQQFLIDCGEGTQMQMQRYNIKRRRINYIFISHLHGDHYFGLIGLLTSMGLMSRTAPLYLFAPAQLKDIINLHLSVAGVKLPYEIIFTPLEEGVSSLLVDTVHYAVKSFPVEHRIACHGFLFTAKSSGRKLNPDKCKEYEIPSSFYPHLKQGEDYTRRDGFVVKNEWVTEPGPKDKKYAYCADTRYTLSYLEHIKGVDAMYHESTYLDDLRERAIERFHSTALQAAELAKIAGVHKLFLGHFSSKYQDLSVFHTEANSIFSDVEITTEGVTYDI
ncbi:MAG: ribonuclease Z [Taibaiella sp.]|jgi:ribonuclease Z